MSDNEISRLSQRVAQLEQENAALRTMNEALTAQLQARPKVAPTPWRPEPLGRHLSDAEVLMPPSW
jgi:hypothetical protein